MTLHEKSPKGNPQDTRMLQHFIHRWPIRVMYQHQGMCVSTWLRLRRALGPHMGLRIVKSSQLPLVFPTGTHPQVHFQGSCCVFGLSSLEDIATLYRVCAMYPNAMVVLGGHWHTQYWTHMDVHHVARVSNVSLLHRDLCDTLYQGLQGVHTSLEYSQRRCTDILYIPTQTIVSLLKV